MGIRNYLVEGVSGTGKTSVCRELTRRGYRAIDGDVELAYQADPRTGKPTSGSAHEHHLWNVDKVRALAADRSDAASFFCGGSRNFADFVDLFDEVFVLEIDARTLDRRLAVRPENEWGGRPSERELVRRLHATREDVPGRGVVIDATRPIERVVDEILDVSGTTPPREPRMDHDEVAERNRVAWTANAYRAWTLRHGTPERAAARIVADPRHPARRLLDFMGGPAGRTVAVPLGSHGRVATALALLGADVTVFDVSESNARYARELAAAAGVSLEYVVGDVQRTALGHPGRFDAVVMDLGIVHYFVDIDAFAASIRILLEPGGTLVLSEFHPLVKKALDVGSGTPTLRGDYFGSGIESAPVPYDAFLDDTSPACSLRRWNLGEIVSAFAGAGLRVRRLVEHPSADCTWLPGTFTLVATADRTPARARATAPETFAPATRAPFGPPPPVAMTRARFATGPRS